MVDTVIQLIQTASVHLIGLLIAVISYPFSPGQRIFWLYLCTSVLMAFGVYLVTQKSKTTSNCSDLSFVNFLFPKEIWSNPSAWLDVRYFLFHQVVRLMIYGVFLTGIMTVIFEAVSGGTSIDDSAFDLDPDTTDIAISLIYMISLAALLDFAAFGLHYLQHKIPFLWEFHKVHHSLEVMHPLSNYREHPVDNILYAAGMGLVYGLFLGGAYLLFGYLPSVPEILGVPLITFIFNMLGYNLRHSHVWLRWPGRWAMAFGCPAHHHVHHSCHPDHIDKNFAFVFPIWDVIFKTYVMPETNKDVQFGLSRTKSYAGEYKSILALYFLPFKKVVEVRKKPKESIKSPPAKS